MKKLVQKALYGVSKPVVKTYAGTMLKMDVHHKCDFPAGREDYCLQPPQHWRSVLCGLHAWIPIFYHDQRCTF